MPQRGEVVGSDHEAVDLQEQVLGREEGEPGRQARPYWVLAPQNGAGGTGREEKRRSGAQLDVHGV